MRKLFYLSTCDTCKRIMKTLNLDDVEVIDIKKQGITQQELEQARTHVSSYTDLLNTRARKLKDLDKSYKEMTEKELESTILSDYTFLKRPLFMSENKVLAGNSKAVVAQLEVELK